MSGFHELGDAAASVTSAISSDNGLRVLAWLLAVVLAWSGTAKLRDPLRAAYAMLDFGVVRHARRSYGVVLGACELVVAVALVVGAEVGGAMLVTATAVAATMFFAFTLAIARSLRAGERFACYCFGEGSSELSAWTLGRAALLTLVSLALAATASDLAAATGATDTALLPGVIGAAAVSIGTLVTRVPALLTWNARPFDLDESHYARRIAR